ncbi:MAG TPA: AEC family transporter [Rhizobiales bacterium]|nr:AEC family transporter [Hyphomicrobiales bacterium]
MDIALSALVPVFLTILAGYAVRRSGLVGETHWQAIDHVAFYVLFPALVIRSIATADLSGVPVLRLVLVLAGGYLAMQAFLLFFRHPVTRLLKINTAAFTSVFQACGRWHTWLGFAMMPALFGPQGLALAAVAAATIVPIGNVSSVIVLSTLNHSGAMKPVKVLKSVAQNPFIIAISIAIAIRFSGLDVPAVLSDTLDLAGKGALGIALLSTGAGLHFSRIHGDLRPLAASLILKMLVLPALIAGLCWFLDVHGIARAVAILAGGVPTAAVSYIFARTMKGDAPLMASIMTLQVMASAITLPVILTIIGY